MSKLLSKKSIKIYLLIVLLISLPFFIKNAFFKPTVLNAIIAEKIYKEPANSAFKDENLYKCVVDTYNSKNKTSVAYTENLTDEQLQTITDLSCNNKGITDVSGIDKLVKLKGLYLNQNSITDIDLSKNIYLEELFLRSNKINEIDINHNTYLNNVYLAENNLNSIDVSNNSELLYLTLSKNNIYELDLKQNKELKTLDVRNNKITKLDVTKNVMLEYLDVGYNQIIDIDLRKNTNLEELYAFYNDLKNIALVNNTNLKILYLSNNTSLTDLSTYKLSELKEFYISHTSLSYIDFSEMTNLQYLYAEGSKLMELDLSNNINIETIYAPNNEIEFIDVTNCLKLKRLVLRFNKIKDIDLSNNVLLESIDLNSNILEKLNLSNNTLLGDYHLYSSIITHENLYVYHNNTIEILKENNDYFILPNFTNQILQKVTIMIGNTATEFSTSTINLKKAMWGGIDSGKYNLIASYTNHSLLYTLYVLELTSDKYKIDDEKDYVYISTDTSKDTLLKNVNLNYGNLVIDNGNLIVKHNENILKTFNIIGIKINTYKTKNGMISVPNEVSYNDFIKNIETNGVSYKIYNGNILITSGNIENGMTVKVYKEETELEEFSITDEYLEFDESLNINEDEKYIYKLKEKTTVNDLLSKINTNGEVTFKNNSGKTLDSSNIIGTESKIIVKLSSKTIEYDLIISGDITGDGKVNSTDVGYIANYIIGTEGYELSDIEKIAADITKEGKVNSTDVGYIANYIIGTEGYESLLK